MNAIVLHLSQSHRRYVLVASIFGLIVTFSNTVTALSEEPLLGNITDNTVETYVLGAWVVNISGKGTADWTLVSLMYTFIYIYIYIIL